MKQIIVKSFHKAWLYGYLEMTSMLGIHYHDQVPWQSDTKIAGSM